MKKPLPRVWANGKSRKMSQPYPADKLTLERHDAIADMVSKFVCYTGDRKGIIAGFHTKPAARLFRALLENKTGIQIVPKGKGWSDKVLKALQAFRKSCRR